MQGIISFTIILTALKQPWTIKLISGLFICRASIYTPRVEEQATRLSNSWQLRTAQRAMSIDNISFTPTAAIMNGGALNSILMDSQDKENDNEDQQSNREKDSRAESRMTNNHDGSMENLKEDDNIIPWRAQLRKTNSRLSLIG